MKLQFKYTLTDEEKASIREDIEQHDKKTAINILKGAIRQYRHNHGAGFVFGYDREATEEIVTRLLSGDDGEESFRERWKEKKTWDEETDEYYPQYDAEEES